MCKKSISENITKNFIITNVILSKKDSFTCEEIIGTLSEEYAIADEKMIKNSIKRLRENDYLEEEGSYYKVLDSRESKRWGNGLMLQGDR